MDRLIDLAIIYDKRFGTNLVPIVRTMLEMEEALSFSTYCSIIVPLSTIRHLKEFDKMLAIQNSELPHVQISSTPFLDTGYHLCWSAEESRKYLRALRLMYKEHYPEQYRQFVGRYKYTRTDNGYTYE